MNVLVIQARSIWLIWRIVVALVKAGILNTDLVNIYYFWVKSKMGNKERQLTINENLKNLDTCYHFKEGVIKINKHNTMIHELGKFLVAYELMKNGFSVYTEVIFKGSMRADIWTANDNHAYEITNTESKESMINKEDKYPCKVSFLKADDVLRQNGIDIKEIRP